MKNSQLCHLPSQLGVSPAKMLSKFHVCLMFSHMLGHMKPTWGLLSYVQNVWQSPTDDVVEDASYVISEPGYIYKPLKLNRYIECAAVHAQ